MKYHSITLDNTWVIKALTMDDAIDDLCRRLKRHVKGIEKLPGYVEVESDDIEFYQGDMLE